MKETIDIRSRIIERCLQGDIRAQHQLYTQYSKAMYNIAIRITGNRMDAEDILQESFVTAFRKLGELESAAAFPGWLRRIVVNRCISLQRKKLPHFEDLEESRVGEWPEEDPDLLDKLDPALVHEAIKALPDGGRSILVMHALEGYKHREIAEVLDISESTSKTQYHRALGLLRKQIKEKQHV